MRPQTIIVTLALLATTSAFAQAPAGPAGAPPVAARPAPGGSEPATTMVVKFKVKPGKEAEFEQAFKEMSQGVRDHEPGNIYYELYRLGPDAQTYVVIERYKDLAAVAAHAQSPHGKKLFAALHDLLDGPPQADRLVFVSSK